MGMPIDVTIKNGIDLIDVIKEYWPSDKAIDTVGELVEIAKKYQQLEDFARWVAGEIIDEDMWVLNYSAFAELACRKLVKLGIIQESNGEYLYEEVEDGEDNIHQ